MKLFLLNWNPLWDMFYSTVNPSSLLVSAQCWCWVSDGLNWTSVILIQGIWDNVWVICCTVWNCHMCEYFDLFKFVVWKWYMHNGMFSYMQVFSWISCPERQKNFFCIWEQTDNKIVISYYIISYCMCMFLSQVKTSEYLLSF